MDFRAVRNVLGYFYVETLDCKYFAVGSSLDEALNILEIHVLKKITL